MTSTTNFTSAFTGPTPLALGRTDRDGDNSATHVGKANEACCCIGGLSIA